MCAFTYLYIPLCCAGFTDIYKLISIKYKVVQQDARLFLAHCGTVPKTDELNQFKISLHRSADGVSAFTWRNGKLTPASWVMINIHIQSATDDRIKIRQTK